MTLIDNEELLLLYDLNSSKNLNVPYWRYDNFDLDTLTDAECKSEFRFLKHDIYTLLEVLNPPGENRLWKPFLRLQWWSSLHAFKTICIST